MEEAVEFALTVKSWVEAKDSNRVDLAREFEVAPSTVDRWWLGTARPHPRLRAQIVRWIELRKVT